MTTQEEVVAWVKRSWKPLAAGAVVVFTIIGVSLWYAVSGVGRKSSIVQAPSPTSTPVTATTTSSLVHRALDGVMVEPSVAALPVFAVMIDNHDNARPQSGIATASLVYEIPVEGGMTRLMAVFDASSTIDQIGPVRSARLYFEEFAQGLGAVYAHVGGSPEALDVAKSWKNFYDLNEFSNGSYFWRSKSRAAPHNVYTRIELLRDAFSKKKWTTKVFVPWKYTDSVASTSTTSGQNVPTIKYPAESSIQWVYDGTIGMYERKDGKMVREDSDGVPVQAKNVVVLETDGQTIDDYGRLKIRTTGKGRAVVYRDGKSFEAVWKRVSGEHVRFETVDGADVLFRPGQTWIQVVLPGMVSQGATTTVP